MATLDSPRDFVQSGWDRARELGDRWSRLTISALDSFAYIQPTAINFEVPVDLQVDYGTFARPQAPPRPVIAEIAVTLPAPPAAADITVPELTPVPAEPSFALAYAKPAAPNRALPTRPDDEEVSLVQIEIPDAPALPDIEDPELYRITLPTMPNFTVPEFEGTRPTHSLQVPQRTFNWQATAYDSSLLTTIQSRLGDMTVNGLGLPPAIEQAIFERTRGREDEISLQAEQEAVADLAHRGLRQPAGLLQRRLDRVRAESRRRTSSANRDLSIAVADRNIDATKFALSQAIALEMALVQANTANNELALRGAEAAQQVGIDLFNAAVALHNADVEGFKADASVYETRIRALSEQINQVKVQIDAQKVIGDVNESLIRGLAERLRARAVLVDLYGKNIEAARAKGEYNTQLLTQRRIRLETFGVDVDAWAKEQDGYRISVDAELGNLRGQEVMANVFGRRIEAWKTVNSGYFEQGRFRIEAQIQRLEQYKAALQGALADLQRQQAGADTKLRTYLADGNIFGAQAQVSALEGDHADRQARMRIETANLRIATSHRSAELNANYMVKIIDQQIEALKGKATVVAQLAASSQSGVNFGASYSGSLSVGSSANYSTGWSYAGDTVDANPPAYIYPSF